METPWRTPGHDAKTVSCREQVDPGARATVSQDFRRVRLSQDPSQNFLIPALLSRFEAFQGTLGPAVRSCCTRIRDFGKCPVDRL